eukprot:TRINITY_DN18265_c0_g1_i1.p1 TRINITY_DN18265_c0_g1~~TRINITY_DN18265_c0_g1_i1.p1  ORF type:complete len:676 (-),score=182.89 TRINITY_DN18265_c0_g1_i1:108-2135(-)
MALPVTSLNGVKCYNLTAGKTLPQWFQDKGRKALRKDEDFRRRVELLQDFEFPIASQCLKASKDGEYIIGTGTYKPQVRCWETAQLSLKFSRHLQSEVVQFQILGDDYKKLAFLGSDRTVEVHAQYGYHYRTRIPKPGRDMTYHNGNCDLYMCGTGNEIYRLNLDQGRFLSPFESSQEDLNCIGLSPAHYLLATGGSSGIVECWDPRVRKRVGHVSPRTFVEDGGEGNEVTCVRFSPSGLEMAAGTSSGHVLLFDLRSNKPAIIKDHQYGLPIIDLKFHNTGRIISSDKKIIKIWDKTQGKLFTSIEPEEDISDVCVVGDSGVILLAGEASRNPGFYIPELGQAPAWCSFLDNITEELEEQGSASHYDNYKFVTKSELQSLGLNHLVGTNLLRPYMHGFFMDMRLYTRTKAISEPFAYEQYRKERIQKKINEKRENRISIQRKIPKVNQAFAEELADRAEAALTQTGKKKKKNAQSEKLLQDDRFSSMFNRPEFQIDTDHYDYKRLHPSQAAMADRSSSRLARDFEDAESEDEYLDDQDTLGSTAALAALASRGEDGDISDGDGGAGETSNRPKMYQLKEGLAGSTLTDTSKRRSSSKRRNVPLAERIRTEVKDAGPIESNYAGGVRQTSFVPSDVLKRRREEKEALKEHKSRKRRGIGELGLSNAPAKDYRRRR